MSLCSKETADMMRSAACLHRNGTGLKLIRKFGKRRSPDAPAQDDPLVCIQAHNAIEVLG